jgi:NAD dependent epimerase/dehydratase family enzyme
LRLLFGEMADECLLSGQNIVPAKLESSGYKFQESEIEVALRRILKN